MNFADIESCLPFPTDQAMDPGGSLNSDLVNWWLPFQSKIVGWYSFRRNNRSCQCSLKDSVLHRQLLNALKIPRDSFLLGHISLKTITSSSSTHSFTQTFRRLNSHSVFEPVRFKVYSLSDKLTNSGGYSLDISLANSTIFNELCNRSHK